MKNILSLENENTILSQNVGHLLPGDATPHPRRRRNQTPISHNALPCCPWCFSQLLRSSHWYIHTFTGKRKLLVCVCMKQMAKLFWLPVSILEIATQNGRYYDTEYMRPCTQMILWSKHRKRRLA